MGSYYDAYLDRHITEGDKLTALGGAGSTTYHAVKVTRTTFNGVEGIALCGYDGGSYYWTAVRDNWDKVECQKCLRAMSKHV